MRLFNKNILLALALLAAAQGCDKEPVTPQDTGAPIMLSAAESGTKALLDNDLFNTDGNRIQVYDFVNDGTTTTKHIDAYAGPDVESNSPLHTYGTTWPFESKKTGEDTTYQWIPGTHKFFGWLAKDANMSSNNTPETFFGDNFKFDESTKELAIPAKEMTPSTPQFDFMYSNIISTEPSNEPVDLEFSHLFSAVSFGVINDGSSKVTITSFSVTLNNKGKASINFNNTSSTSPVVTYTKTSQNPSIFRQLNNSITLSGLTNKQNVFNISDNEKSYILIWPQTQNELTKCKISVSYKIGSTNYNTTKEISFPVNELDPGKRYHFDISFIDKQTVQINYLVVDWNKIENEYTFQ